MKSRADEPTIEELQILIRKFCDDRDWDQFHNFKDLAISLLLEATEVLEHFQWKNTNEVIEHGTLHKTEIAEELADVFYWVLLLANKLNINLIDAFQSKMHQNEAKYPIHKAKGRHDKYTELEKS
jgi:NTP pyrophosphatase (non-canonical NTP hydrolase)